MWHASIISVLWFLLLHWKLNMNWQQGYAPPNSDRREGILRRKRLEYLDCVAQYYDIPDSERTDEEINMLRQVIWILVNRFSWLLLISPDNILSCFSCFRLLLIVLELYLMYHSFNNLKFRNPWNVYFTRGKILFCVMFSLELMLYRPSMMSGQLINRRKKFLMYP